MTGLQYYLISSVLIFLLLAVLLNGGNTASNLLKIACWIMVIIGTIVSLASLGVLVAGNIRLV